MADLDFFGDSVLQCGLDFGNSKKTSPITQQKFFLEKVIYFAETSRVVCMIYFYAHALRTKTQQLCYAQVHVRTSVEDRLMGHDHLSWVHSFFLFGFSFHEHSRFTWQQGKGEAVTLTPFYQLHRLHRHLDMRKSLTTKLRALGVQLQTIIKLNQLFDKLKNSTSI